MKNIFRGMALLFIPFGGLVPSGVALLWVSNSFFSVLVRTYAGLSLPNWVMQLLIAAYALAVNTNQLR